MKSVVIHSDGGCHGNPGPGAWAAVIEYGAHRRELSGGELATTNNRMELMAAIQALNALKESCRVEFFTDSEYLRQGIMTWVAGWKRNGWRTSKKTAVKNGDLWLHLDAAAARHVIEWKWLKGHAGHVGNERCDELSQIAIAQIKQSHSSTQLQEALAAFTARAAEDPALSLF